MSKKTGIVGTGNMGGGMAKRLLDLGWPVYVHDLDTIKQSELQTAGAQGCAHAAAVAQAAGTPALDGLGLPGGDAHTDHEWAELNLVVPRLYLITRLIMDMGAKPPRK
mgnify:CR=1 FL=1